jgi:hypothetical protein
MHLPLKRRSNEIEKFDATSAVVIPSVEEQNSKCRSKPKPRIVPCDAASDMSSRAK